MKSITIDANVFLRYLTGDNPAHVLGRDSFLIAVENTSASGRRGCSRDAHFSHGLETQGTWHGLSSR